MFRASSGVFRVAWRAWFKPRNVVTTRVTRVTYFVWRESERLKTRIGREDHEKQECAEAGDSASAGCS